MKFGLFGLHRGPGIAPDVLTRRAGAAEETGFESLWVGDHIALPADMPGSDDPRLEALAALLYLAAVTTTVRLAAGVLVIPQRNPVLMAKQLTSLDVLSEGRLIVGVGVGHVEAELTAFGVSMSNGEIEPRMAWLGCGTCGQDHERVGMALWTMGSSSSLHRYRIRTLRSWSEVTPKQHLPGRLASAMDGSAGSPRQTELAN